MTIPITMFHIYISFYLSSRQIHGVMFMGTLVGVDEVGRMMSFIHAPTFSQQFIKSKLCKKKKKLPLLIKSYSKPAIPAVPLSGREGLGPYSQNIVRLKIELEESP